MGKSTDSRGDGNDKAGSVFTEFMARFEEATRIGDDPASRIDHEFKGALAKAFNGMPPIA